MLVARPPGPYSVPLDPPRVTRNAVHLPSSHDTPGPNSVNRTDIALPLRERSKAPYSIRSHRLIPRRTPKQAGAVPGCTGARSSPEGAGGSPGPAPPGSPGGLAGGGCSEQREAAPPASKLFVISSRGSRSPSPLGLPHPAARLPGLGPFPSPRTAGPRDPPTSAATADGQRVSEGGPAPRPRGGRRPGSRTLPARSRAPRPAPPAPRPRDLSPCRRRRGRPRPRDPGPHPRQGEVGHELLEGPRLLGLPLRVQRDLLTELPRVGAAGARRGGHGAGPAPAGGGRRRARALSRPTRPSASQPQPPPEARPPARPGRGAAAAPPPASGRERAEVRPRAPGPALGAARPPPGPDPAPRPPPEGFPRRPAPGSRPAARTPRGDPRLARQSGPDVREPLGYHFTEALPGRARLAFGLTLQFSKSLNTLLALPSQADFLQRGENGRPTLEQSSPSVPTPVGPNSCPPSSASQPASSLDLCR